MRLLNVSCTLTELSKGPISALKYSEFIQWVRNWWRSGLRHWIDKLGNWLSRWIARRNEFHSLEYVHWFLYQRRLTHRIAMTLSENWSLEYSALLGLGRYASRRCISEQSSSEFKLDILGTDDGWSNVDVILIWLNTDCYILQCRTIADCFKRFTLHKIEEE